MIGGIAVQGHGYIRATYDLDIIVEPTTLNLTRLSEALAELGAELRSPGTLNLADPHQLRRAPLDSHHDQVRPARCGPRRARGRPPEEL